MIVKHSAYDLTSRNTFRMKVRCALYVEVTEEADLAALDWVALPQPVFVMGGGSNLLFTGDFPGTVLHYANKARLDQVQGLAGPVGPGPILCGGPGPASMGQSGSEGISGGPGPGDKSGPGPQAPNIGWTWSKDGGLLITIPAGTVFDDFCAWAAAEGLWGPENLSLIPGEVGASAVQNIGAYGVEAKDIIADIRAWDRQNGCFVNIDPATCAYGYRTSKFKTDWKGRYVITAVTYRLSTTPQPKLDYGGVRKALEMAGHSESPCHSEHGEESLTPQLIRDTIIGIRRQKLPAVEEIGNAGSFFCNPVIGQEHFARIVATARQDNGPDYQVPHYDTPEGVKVPAAWMIEQCGFKGARNGGAQVYQKQPLVIVNATGSATSQEIIGLEQQIIEAIEKKYGITLHPEVEHV